jgi:hypothetical protein
VDPSGNSLSNAPASWFCSFRVAGTPGKVSCSSVGYTIHHQPYTLDNWFRGSPCLRERGSECLVQTSLRVSRMFPSWCSMGTHWLNDAAWRSASLSPNECFPTILWQGHDLIISAWRSATLSPNECCPTIFWNQTNYNFY